ncbi:MAG TPA: DUF4340 domain-containing protein [Burkholderiales bacterium]|nr:DUF4340 domain-containing protein [Burkholderiales bacterium]
MNRKQFLFLVLALIVLGGAGIALFRQDIADYRASGAKIGARLLPQFKLADVAQMRLQDGKSQVTLVRKDNGWVVRDRGDYPASFQQISDLMVKLAELKVTQSEQVGPSLLGRIELNEPGKGEGVGTLVEFKDPQDKPLARVVLGKVVKKKDPLNPLPNAVDGVPAGRYVLPANAKDTVVVVSDPLSGADANPGKWLNRDFFKVERIRTLTVGPEGFAPGWKITRTEEWGQWKFATGGGDLAAGAAVAAVNALGSMSFNDVAMNPKPEEGAKPVAVVAETFDNLTYTLKIVAQKTGEEYLVNVSVAGEPPKARTPEKNEKADLKERRDKEFAESRKRLEERVAREQALSKWTYAVSKKEVEPLLKERSDLVAKKPAKDEKGAMPRMPF